MMEIKYHFLTASTSYYSGNNFNDLLKEEADNEGYIYWHIGNHKIYVNDVCYIYYSNLPDGSSRILFVGKVIESDINNDGKSICPDAEIGQKYIKIKLKSVSLEDNEKFNLYNLRKKYNLISDKGQFSYLHIDNKKHKKLIDDLDKASESSHFLRYVHEYFDDNYCMCEFGCKTFIEENGFHYIENHHLVEKNLIEKNKNIKDIDKLINDKNNLFKLCPMCHRKIHHAKVDERKEMINILYNKNKKYFDTAYNAIKGNKNTLKWLYEIYKCY